MLYFLNDYSEGAHPRVMQALQSTNGESTVGYGEDPYCRKAAAQLRALEYLKRCRGGSRELIL